MEPVSGIRPAGEAGRRFLSRLVRTSAFAAASLAIALFMAAAAGIGALLITSMNRMMTDDVLEGLAAEAAALEAEAARGSAKDLEARLAAGAGPGSTRLYFLADAQGNKLAGNIEALPPGIGRGEKGDIFYYTAGGRERLAVAVQVAIPAGRLVIGRDIEGQRALAGRVHTIFLAGFGVLALAALAAALLASRITLKRIETISATARSIMGGDLSQRIPLAGAEDELDHLARQLNTMLERIEQLLEGMREISSSIAHDLKTPLNRLHSRLESALADPRGPPAYREGLEQALEDVAGLIKIFNALLLIARIEAGAIEDEAECFDAGALVRDAADLYEPVAEEAGLCLEVEAPADIMVRANRQLAGQAVANLIDNAIKYSKGGAEKRPPSLRAIWLRVRHKAPDNVEIAVADHGPGIAPEDRERALRRFVRLEASRTEPGTGLGLSLVTAVARLYGGALRLEDNEPGLRAVLELPQTRTESKKA